MKFYKKQLWDIEYRKSYEGEFHKQSENLGGNPQGQENRLIVVEC
jgi:hypothetical protein